MKTYGKVGVFLTSAMLEMCSVSRRGCFSPGERAPGTRWIGDWEDPRVSLRDTEKWKFSTLPGLEFRSLGRPASSQSLYRLRYRAFRTLKSSETVRGWRKMHNRYLRNTNSSPNKTGMNKYRRERCTGHVARTGSRGMRIRPFLETARRKERDH
jgi:hypothetical protein